MKQPYINIQPDRSRHTTRSSRGLTLVEVMVTLFVLTIMVMIFASIQVMANKTAHVNGEYAQALSLCQHKIDQIRAVGFGRLNYEELNDAGIIDDSPTDPTNFSFKVVDGVDDVNEHLLPSATTRINIQQPWAYAFYQTKVSQVTVTLTWKKSRFKNETCTLSLSALIANIE